LILLRIPGKLCAKHFVLGVQRKLNNYVILISAFVLGFTLAQLALAEVIVEA
jgi:hypothetical protein